MIRLSSPYHRLRINCSALLHNLDRLRGRLPAHGKVAAVIKADAYGHGAARLAGIFKKAGVEALALSKASEGAELRRQGINGPLWLLMGAPPQEAALIAASRLWPVSHDMELFEALSRAGCEHNRPVDCLLKIDVGMNRLGILPEHAPEFMAALQSLPGVKVRGLLGHLSHGGDGGSDCSARQSRLFCGLLRQLRAQGHDLPASSLLNSGGVMALPSGGDVLSLAPWVRLGVALYGGLPDLSLGGGSDLLPAMTLDSRVIAVHRARAGSRISYGGAYQFAEDSLIATVPVGYGDGYPRSLSNRGFMLINGCPAPIRGRVCMNMTMVEVENIKPQPRPGDQVTLLGRQGEGLITVDDLAEWAGTIGYEIMCRLGASLEREYTEL
ncbi:MAG: alanine racemase [Desulfarculales bacterium]|nr:alanine racemase [Desulfarculales bacterium]